MAVPLLVASLTPMTAAISAASVATTPTIATVTAREGAASVDHGLGLVPVRDPDQGGVVTPDREVAAAIADPGPGLLRILRGEVDLSLQ